MRNANIGWHDPISNPGLLCHWFPRNGQQRAFGPGFSRLGAVYIQWYPDHLLITNPGRLPVGITPDNILVHEPKPRNPRLAKVFRRISLIEQTGRGVDKIFMGQLRYGRPTPDFSRSDPEGVQVVLRGGEASQDFATFVFEVDLTGKFLQLDGLQVLNLLFFERRIDLSERRS